MSFRMARIRPYVYGTFEKCAPVLNTRLSKATIMESPTSIIGIAFSFWKNLDFLQRPSPRYSRYTRPRYKFHPQDCSVMTFKGHLVLQTLIRCHFSPSETTGSQYLYSGSADGRIHVCRLKYAVKTFKSLTPSAQIWSLDGRVVHILDRSKTMPPSFDPSGPEHQPTTSYSRKGYCVRDVSWHTQVHYLI